MRKLTPQETELVVRTASAHKAAILQGVAMKLVPVEPTPEMLDAAGESIYGHPREKATEWAKTEKFESCAQVGVEAYRVMLAAAPAIHEGGEHA